MDNSKIDTNGDAHETEFKRFATKRIIAGILLTVVVLWVVGTVLGFFEKPSGTKIASRHESKTEHAALPENIKPAYKNTGESAHENNVKQSEITHEEARAEAAHGAKQEMEPHALHKSKENLEKSARQTHVATTEKTPEHPKGDHTPAASMEDKTGEHATSISEGVSPDTSLHQPVGVAFVNAVIEPINFELNKRFWGWRPNDILNFTDNINNFQLGVLEVTRRTAVALAERISRTGSTAAFDDNLQNAMNWFMVKANRYWFPSPESKYKAGIKELEHYKEKLMTGKGNFYTRPDNLIPLLMTYEDLLGSCEENLVRQQEEDGSDVSFFKADDYFFYSKGVASAMLTILEAITKDFHLSVESRRGAEVIHHAIESCHHATQVKPLLITNSSLSGILANHRANLAAPMSHARFFIGVLIKTLST